MDKGGTMTYEIRKVLYKDSRIKVSHPLRVYAPFHFFGVYDMSNGEAKHLKDFESLSGARKYRDGLV